MSHNTEKKTKGDYLASNEFVSTLNVPKIKEGTLLYHWEILHETFYPVYVLFGIRYIRFALYPVWVVVLSKVVVLTP